MTSVANLEQAPTLAEFVVEVRAAEDPARRHAVTARELRLDASGSLVVDGKALSGAFLLSEEARADLARLAGIPVPYFVEKCDPELRALSFNYLLDRDLPRAAHLQVVIRDDRVDRVLNARLLSPPRAPVLDAVLNAIPNGVERDKVRAVRHAWNGHFDLSAIAPGLACEPHPGDMVAFGVNVCEGRDGAIQVQGASFRLLCANGAIIRICDGRRHRLRRPSRPDHLNLFLQKVNDSAREAFEQWSENAAKLQELKGVPLGEQHHDALRSRLRQAPFFLSAGVVEQVLRRLDVEVGEPAAEPTLLDLWNALSFLGTHETRLSPVYRRRLRLGAGEFTRNSPHVCRSCRQLVFRGGTAHRADGTNDKNGTSEP